MLQITDPRTYDATTFRDELMTACIKYYFAYDKDNFLKSYSLLTQGEKFYTLVATVINMVDIDEAKRLYLPELDNDLRVLKTLNKPNSSGTAKHSKELFDQFPKYVYYLKDNTCWKTLCKYEDIAIEASKHLVTGKQTA